MVTPDDFRAIAVARGVDLRSDVDVIMAFSDTLASLIDLAEESQLVILGLDGFKMDGAVVLPLLDFIADFSSVEGSWESRVKESARVAREVSRAWRPLPDLIEVTLDGLDE